MVFQHAVVLKGKTVEMRQIVLQASRKSHMLGGTEVRKMVLELNLIQMEQDDMFIMLKLILIEICYRVQDT